VCCQRAGRGRGRAQAAELGGAPNLRAHLCRASASAQIPFQGSVQCNVTTMHCIATEFSDRCCCFWAVPWGTCMRRECKRPVPPVRSAQCNAMHCNFTHCNFVQRWAGGAMRRERQAQGMRSCTAGMQAAVSNAPFHAAQCQLHLWLRVGAVLQAAQALAVVHTPGACTLSTRSPLLQ
jgi:hypothetical protein